MKVVPFRVPQTSTQAFRVQRDALPYFYDKLHQHSELQIMIIEQGEGTVVAGNYIGRFRPGDVFVLGSNQPHVFRSDESYYTKANKRGAKSTSIYFNESYFGKRFWDLEEMKSLRLFFNRAQKGFRVIGSARESVIALVNQLRNAAELPRLTIFFQLLQLLISTKDLKPLNKQSLPETSVESKRMDDILQFTFKQSHRKIYITEVADIANLSTEAFCRYFKVRTRKTYTNFLNEVRVNNACKLLANRDRKIEQVCFETGFQNVSNFNRIFKKFIGITPSSYAKKTFCNNPIIEDILGELNREDSEDEEEHYVTQCSVCGLIGF